MKNQNEHSFEVEAVIILFIGFLFLLAIGGCTSIKKSIDEKRTNKAKLQFDRHPDTAAHYCAVHFPVKDSTPDPIYKPADNKDYSKTIDSLNAQIDSLQQDWDSMISGATNNLGSIYQKQILNYQQRLSLLKDSIYKLKANYKPCKPDTLFQDHFTLDGAAVIDMENKYQAERVKRETTEKSLLEVKGVAKIRFWMLIAAGILILLLAVILFYSLKAKLIK